MEEIKLSGNNRLPKYWCVQCPEENSPNHELFLNTVIKYMRDVIGEYWVGNLWGSYYGYDGNDKFRGTDHFREVKSFKNNPTLLTLQQFIDCFKEEATVTKPKPSRKVIKEPEFTLPVKWRVEVTNLEDVEQYLIDTYGEVDTWCKETKEFWLYSEKNRCFAIPSYVSTARNDSYTKITMEQFKQYVMKETFKLPKKWCINKTANPSVIGGWFNENSDVALKDRRAVDYVVDLMNHPYLHFPKAYSGSCTNNKPVSGYTEITFEQFKKYVIGEPVETSEKAKCEVEEFKVPEKWCIRVEEYNTPVEVYEWRKRTEYGSNWIDSGYIHSTGLHCDKMSGYTEITFEQFVNYIYKSKTITMEKCTIGGSTTLKEAFIKECGIKPFSTETSTYKYIRTDSGDICGVNFKQGKHFELPKDWDAALAHVKAFYAKPESKTLYFGKLKCTIKEGNDYAVTEYGNISKAEIQKVLKLFNANMSICGYDLQIENVDDIVIAFGCQKGTIREAKAILEAFNTK